MALGVSWTPVSPPYYPVPRGAKCKSGQGFGCLRLFSKVLGNTESLSTLEARPR